jgi:XTP/dITP diphosphohydrolase
LVIGTHNRDKGREIMAVLGSLDLELRGLWQWPDARPVPEDGQTLEDNAILKAEGALRQTGWWAMADDTGLEVDYLDGAPGVFSARYAGPRARYADNCRKLLAALTDVPREQRTAHFRTVIALARPGLATEIVEGVVRGEILDREVGGEGFGYDPVFYYPPAGKTFAEMTLAEKNAVSHRGLALAALKSRLIELLVTPGPGSGAL